MSDVHKFYYLRLKDDFFITPDSLYLLSLDNGYEMLIIYLQLLLLSLNTDGELSFRGKPYTPKILSKVIFHDEEILNTTIKELQDLNLLTIRNDGKMFLTDMQLLIGSSSSEAERMRQYRKKISTVESNEDISSSKQAKTEKGKKERKKFEPPTVEELKAYAEEISFNLDPCEFLDYYNQNDWKFIKTGKPIKDWKACVRTWKRNQLNRGDNNFYRNTGNISEHYNESSDYQTKNRF